MGSMEGYRQLWRQLDAPGRAALLDELEAIYSAWPQFRDFVDLDSETAPALNRDPWGGESRYTIGINKAPGAAVAPSSAWFYLLLAAGVILVAGVWSRYYRAQL